MSEDWTPLLGSPEAWEGTAQALGLWVFFPILAFVVCLWVGGRVPKIPSLVLAAVAVVGAHAFAVTWWGSRIELDLTSPEHRGALARAYTPVFLMGLLGAALRRKAYEKHG